MSLEPHGAVNSVSAAPVASPLNVLARAVKLSPGRSIGKSLLVHHAMLKGRVNDTAGPDSAARRIGVMR